MRKLAGIVVVALVGIVSLRPASAEVTPQAVPPTNFAPHVDYAVAVPVSDAAPTRIVRGDFNRDGYDDLAAAGHLSGFLSVLLGSGTGTFGAATNYSVHGSDASSVVTADFNGDGAHDLATANYENNDVSVLLATGTGSFLTARNTPVNYGPSRLAAADFDGDGQSDLAVQTSTGGDQPPFQLQITMLRGRGDGSFTSGASTNIDSGIEGLTAEDFDGDGNSDLLAQYVFKEDVSVFPGTGTGTFNPPTSFPVGGHQGTGIVAGDLDGDGDVDVVASHYDAISVLLGTGTGGFGPRRTYAAGGFVGAATLGDFNLDGHQDVAVPVVGINPVASILYGTGDGSLVDPSNARFPVGRNPNSVVAGDFNEDGRPDLATANFAPEPSISVLLNDPAPHASLSAANRYEGGSGTIGLDVRVQLDIASDQAVTAHYTTRDGTAIAGSDYVASRGTVTIPPGETEAALPIKILGDKVVEPHETLFVDILGVQGAKVGIATVQVLIFNDDKPPRVTPQNSARMEGGSGTTTAAVRISLDHPSPDLTVTVRFNTRDGSALAGSDYAAKSGTVTFAPGDTSAVITISLFGDKLSEPDEQFFVDIHHVQNGVIARTTATVTILNDDS